MRKIIESITRYFKQIRRKNDKKSKKQSNIKYISFNDIFVSENCNIYMESDIETLYRSIEKEGLQRALTVVSKNTEGKYELIDGKRRLDVINKLRLNNQKRYQRLFPNELIPVIVLESLNVDDFKMIIDKN